MEPQAKRARPNGDVPSGLQSNTLTTKSSSANTVSSTGGQSTSTQVSHGKNTLGAITGNKLPNSDQKPLVMSIRSLESSIEAMRNKITEAFGVVFGSDKSLASAATAAKELHLARQQLDLARSQQSLCVTADDMIRAKTLIQECLQNLQAANTKNDRAQARLRSSASKELPELIDRIKLIKAARSTRHNEESRGESSSIADFEAIQQHSMLRHRGFVCPNCGNDDEGRMVDDDKTNDKICVRCGCTVAANQLKDEDWARVKTDQESGEVMSTFGDRPSRFMSSQFNLGTSFSSRPGVSKSQLQQFGRVTANIENIAHRGAWEEGVQTGQTRTYYKDEMKRKQFRILETVADRLRINGVVLERAKEYFAQFRDDRDKVHHKDKVTAACLIAAYEDHVSSTRRETPVTNTNGTVQHKVDHVQHVSCSESGTSDSDSDSDSDENGEDDKNNHPNGTNGTTAPSTTTNSTQPSSTVDSVQSNTSNGLATNNKMPQMNAQRALELAKRREARDKELKRRTYLTTRSKFII